MYKLKISGSLAISILLITGLFLISSCKKDSEDDTPGGGNPPGGNTVSTNFSVKVIDENNTPMAGVAVDVYGSIAMTDGTGTATINAAAIPIEDAGRMKVAFEKDGYFDHMIGVTPKINSSTFTSVVLLEKELAGTIGNTSGGTVSGDQNRINATISPASYVMEGGEAYTGDVNIYMKYINPDEEDFSLAMPGGSDLYAVDNNGEEGIMESFGALYMTAETPSGEMLKPSPAANFDMCVDIPPGMLSFAPASIQIWILNEDAGWRATITAQRVGNQYCFNTSVDGAINCDVLRSGAFLEGTVCNENFQPAPRVKVQVGQTIAYTNDVGEYSMIVRANQTQNIVSPYCNKTLPELEKGTVETVNVGCVEGDCGGEYYLDITVDGQPISFSELPEFSGSIEDGFLHVYEGDEDLGDLYYFIINWNIDATGIEAGNSYTFGGGTLFNTSDISGQLGQLSPPFDFWDDPIDCTNCFGGTISVSEYVDNEVIAGEFNNIRFRHNFEPYDDTFVNGTFRLKHVNVD